MIKVVILLSFLLLLQPYLPLLLMLLLTFILLLQLYLFLLLLLLLLPLLLMWLIVLTLPQLTIVTLPRVVIHLIGDMVEGVVGDVVEGIIGDLILAHLLITFPNVPYSFSNPLLFIGYPQGPNFSLRNPGTGYTYFSLFFDDQLLEYISNKTKTPSFSTG